MIGVMASTTTGICLGKQNMTNNVQQEHITPPVVYTVQRCRKNDTRYGATHGSSDGEFTLCGLELDHNWWIVTSAFDGVVTCKKCGKVINNK